MPETQPPCAISSVISKRQALGDLGLHFGGHEFLDLLLCWPELYPGENTSEGEFGPPQSLASAILRPRPTYADRRASGPSLFPQPGAWTVCSCVRLMRIPVLSCIHQPRRPLFFCWQRRRSTNQAAIRKRTVSKAETNSLPVWTRLNVRHRLGATVETTSTLPVKNCPPVRYRIRGEPAVQRFPLDFGRSLSRNRELDQQHGPGTRDRVPPPTRQRPSCR
jgi:hypothetical protein